MYVCICICMHVNVCHVYIVCHLQKLAAAAKRRSLPLDHPSQLDPPLDITSPSGPACLLATLPSPHRLTWNRGVSEDRRVLGRKKGFLARKNSWLRLGTEGSWPIPHQGGQCGIRKGNGNYRNVTIPVTIPGSIPGNYGKSHPWMQEVPLFFRGDIQPIPLGHFRKLKAQSSNVSFFAFETAFENVTPSGIGCTSLKVVPNHNQPTNQPEQ